MSGASYGTFVAGSNAPASFYYPGSSGGMSGLARVAYTGQYADLTSPPTLATVATSGKYLDLTGLPNLQPVAVSGQYTDLSGLPALKPVATAGTYASLTGTPTLATVATSGRFSDLTITPPFTVSGQDGGNRVANFITSGAAASYLSLGSALTNGNAAVLAWTGANQMALGVLGGTSMALDNTGKLTLAGLAVTGSVTGPLNVAGQDGTAAAINALSNGAIVANVFLGSAKTNGQSVFLQYNGGFGALGVYGGTTLTFDATGKLGVNSLTVAGTPLAAVATTGAYSSLSGTPTLAAVATSGSYNDLLNKPTTQPTNQITGPATLSASTSANAVLLFQNTVGGAGSYNRLDFATYTGATNGQPVSLQVTDDGNLSGNAQLLAKIPGSASNAQRALFQWNSDRSMLGYGRTVFPIDQGDWAAATGGSANRGDGYGFGQYTNGQVRVWSAGNYTPSNVCLGAANNDGSYNDYLLAGFNGVLIRRGNNASSSRYILTSTTQTVGYVNGGTVLQGWGSPVAPAVSTNLAYLTQSNGVFTIPVHGVYHITLTLCWGVPTQNSGNVTLYGNQTWIQANFVNGIGVADLCRGTKDLLNNGTSPNYTQISTTNTFNAGDTFTIYNNLSNAYSGTNASAPVVQNNTYLFVTRTLNYF